MLTGLDLFLLHLRNSGNRVKQWPCPKKIEIFLQLRQPSIYPEFPPKNPFITSECDFCVSKRAKIKIFQTLSHIYFVSLDLTGARLKEI